MATKNKEEELNAIMDELKKQITSLQENLTKEELMKLVSEASTLLLSFMFCFCFPFSSCNLFLPTNLTTRMQLTVMKEKKNVGSI